MCGLFVGSMRHFVALFLHSDMTILHVLSVNC